MQNVSLDKFPLHQEMIGQALQEDAFSNPIEHIVKQSDILKILVQILMSGNRSK